MQLESYKEKTVYLIELLSDGLDRLGSGSSQERGKSRYILGGAKNKKQKTQAPPLWPPSCPLILNEYLPLNPLSQVTKVKKWFIWFLILTCTLKYSGLLKHNS